MAKLNFKDLIFKFLQKDEDHDCEKVHPKMSHKEWMNTEPVKTVKENIEVYITKKDYVVVDENLIRPAEVDTLLADYSKAKKILKWEPKISFDDLVTNMVESDLEFIKLYG